MSVEQEIYVVRLYRGDHFTHSEKLTPYFNDKVVSGEISTRNSVILSVTEMVSGQRLQSFVIVCWQVVCYHSHALHDTPTQVDNSNSFMFTQNLMFLLTDNMLFPSRPHICPPYRWASILPGPSAQCSCSAPLGWWRTPVSTMCSSVFIAGMDVWII